MKNQDKALLPKIQIKQVQVLNRALGSNAGKAGLPGAVNGMAGYNSTETVTTQTLTGIY